MDIKILHSRNLDDKTKRENICYLKSFVLDFDMILLLEQRPSDLI